MEEKKFEKLVLARQQVIKTEGIQTSSIFEHACRMYPRMMVYEFTIPKGPTWVGCTPELLISGKDGVYRTTALAGTLPLPPMQNNDSEEYPLDIWDSKNLSEQKIVEHYIEQILRTYAADIIKSKPYTARAGQLLHIRTDFEFTLKEGMQVIKALHPTPAVCGLPKKEALAFIDNCETGNREYYAGFLGKWNVDGETELYVNLRCARTEPEEQLRLFVGSGLLESSTCDSEWNETEHKMRTIIDTL